MRSVRLLCHASSTRHPVTRLITEWKSWMPGSSQSGYDTARGDNGAEWTSFNEGSYTYL
ncbi:hypothetical protein HYDPIDRAFT_116291 [Hydnomerulius pinastri MD-312]|uniref:Unplaced genomic scaffold scaffold_30, whole genome shotgun sequence n=1 Tax=Hydnomerulius pinastri MD-312 TaxID=994086 RepID=A0A0C9WC01_9AGAM|nr:hypothetical protein HYDPIDRAFT_116291 [Hydnomerulius pinastri MD-312]